VSVALQLDDGTRVVERIATTWTLWALLETFANRIGGDRYA